METLKVARLVGTGRAIEMILTGRFVDADQRTGQVIEQLAQALLYTTADKAEGASAFLEEERPPSFRGA